MANNLWDTIKGLFSNKSDTSTTGIGSSGAGSASVQTGQQQSQSTITSYNSGIRGTQEYAKKNYDSFKEQYNLARKAGVSDDQFYKDYGNGTRWLDQANQSSSRIRQYDSGVKGTREYAQANMPEFRTQYKLAQQAGISDNDFYALFGQGYRWTDDAKPKIISFESGIRGTREYASSHMDEFRSQYRLAKDAGYTDDEFYAAYGNGTRWREGSSNVSLMADGEYDQSWFEKLRSNINDSSIANAMNDRRLKRLKEKYGSAFFDDDFSGQFKANFGVGRIQEEYFQAWSDYMDKPDEANAQYVQELQTLLEQFQANNVSALDDENVQFGWLSKQMASYFPQLWNQTKTSILPGIIGAIGGGLVAGIPGAFTGAKIGGVAGSGVYSYNNMRGAAFATLTQSGVDQETARKAANDEALVSSIIEMGDTAVDLFTMIPGLGSAAKNAAKDVAVKSASKNIVKLLGEYGFNIGEEYGEEFVQEILSMANERRCLNGNADSGVMGLLSEATKLIGEMLGGEAGDELAQAREAGKGGAIIGAFMGGIHMGAGQVVTAYDNNKIRNQLSLVEDGKLSGYSDSYLKKMMNAAISPATKNERAAEIIRSEMDRRAKLDEDFADVSTGGILKSVSENASDKAKGKVDKKNLAVLDALTRNDVSPDKVSREALFRLFREAQKLGSKKGYLVLYNEIMSRTIAEVRSSQSPSDSTLPTQMAQQETVQPTETVAETPAEAPSVSETEAPVAPVTQEAEQAAPERAQESDEEAMLRLLSQAAEEQQEGVEVQPTEGVAVEQGSTVSESEPEAKENPLLKSRKKQAKFSDLTDDEKAEWIARKASEGKKLTKAERAFLDSVSDSFDGLYEEEPESMDAIFRRAVAQQKAVKRAEAQNKMAAAWMAKEKEKREQRKKEDQRMRVIDYGSAEAGMNVRDWGRRSFAEKEEKKKTPPRPVNLTGNAEGDWKRELSSVKAKKRKSRATEQRLAFGDTSKDIESDTLEYPSDVDFATLDRISGEVIPASFDFSDVEGFAQYYGLSEKEVDGMLASIVKEINEYGYEDVFGHSYGSEKERFLVESVLDAFYSSDPEQQSLFIIDILRENSVSYSDYDYSIANALANGTFSPEERRSGLLGFDAMRDGESASAEDVGEIGTPTEIGGRTIYISENDDGTQTQRVLLPTNNDDGNPEYLSAENGGKILEDSDVHPVFPQFKKFFAKKWALRDIIVTDSGFSIDTLADGKLSRLAGHLDGIMYGSISDPQNTIIAANVSDKGAFAHEVSHRLQMLAENVDIGQALTLIDEMLEDVSVLDKELYSAAYDTLASIYYEDIQAQIDDYLDDKWEKDPFWALGLTDSELEKEIGLIMKAMEELVVYKEMFANIAGRCSVYGIPFYKASQALIEHPAFRRLVTLAAQASGATYNDIEILLNWYGIIGGSAETLGDTLPESVNRLYEIISQRKTGRSSENGQTQSQAPRWSSEITRISSEAPFAGSRGRNNSNDNRGSRRYSQQGVQGVRYGADYERSYLRSGESDQRTDRKVSKGKKKEWWGKGLYRPTEEELATYPRPTKDEVVSYIDTREAGRPDNISGERFWEYMSRVRDDGKTLWDDMRGYHWKTYYEKNWEAQRDRIEGERAKRKAVFDKWRKEGYDALSPDEQEIIDNWQEKKDHEKAVIASLRRFLKDGYSALDEDQKSIAAKEILAHLQRTDPELRATFSDEQTVFSESLTPEQEAALSKAAKEIINKLQPNRLISYANEQSRYSLTFMDPEESMEDYLESLALTEEAGIPPEQEAVPDINEFEQPQTPAEQKARARQRRRETYGARAERAPIDLDDMTPRQKEPAFDRAAPPVDVSEEERDLARQRSREDAAQREQAAEEARQRSRDRARIEYGRNAPAIFSAASEIGTSNPAFAGNNARLGNAFKSVQDAAQHVADGDMSAGEFAKFYLNMRKDPMLAQLVLDHVAAAMEDCLEKYGDAVDMPSSYTRQAYAASAEKAMNLAAHSIHQIDSVMRMQAELTDLVKENGRGKPKAKSGIVNLGRNVRDFFVRMQMSPENVFRGLLGGWNAGEGNRGYKLADQITKANITHQHVIAGSQMAFVPVRKVDGIESFISGKSKTRIKTQYGFDMELSDVELASLYKTIKTLEAEQKTFPGRLDTLGGFAFGSKDAPVFFDLQAAHGDIPAGIYLSDLRETIAAHLSDAAKAYIDAADGVLADLAKRNADAEMQTNGVRPMMYGKGDYVPLRYVSNSDLESFSKGENIDFTFLHERTRAGGGFVWIQPLTTVVDRYITQSANHIAYSELGRTFELLSRDSSSGKGIVSLMGDNYGRQFSEWMENFIEDVRDFNPQERTDGVSSLLRAGRQAVQTGALVGSVSVPIKQVSSYWAASGKLRMSSLVKAYRPKVVPARRGAFQQNKQNSLLLYNRRVGGIDPTLSEAMGSNGAWGALKKNSKLLQLIEKAIPVEDYLTVSNVYDACVIEMREDHPNMDVNSQEFAELVESKFEEVVMETQPIFTKNARPEYARTDNELIKLFSMFRTQQTQNFNRIIRSIGEYRKAKGTAGEFLAYSELHETLKGQAASALSLAALSVIADIALHKLRKYRDDDDEEIEPEKILERIGLNAIEGAAGTAWFGDSVLKWGIDKLSAATGNETSEFYGVNMGIISTIGNVVDSIGWFLQSPTASNARYVAGYIAQAFGIPLNNAYQMLNSATVYASDLLGKNDDHYDDVLKYLDKEVFATKTDSEKDKARVLINAYLKGNDSKAERVNQLLDPEKSESTIRSDVKSRVLDGSITAEQAENILLKYTEMTPADVEKKNSFWEFMRDNPQYDDVSESFVKSYNDYAEPADIPVNQFYEYMQKAKDTHSIDVDGDGKANGKNDITKQAQLMEYINSLNLSKEQKDALWLAFGYKTTSKAYKNRPWK